MRKTIKFTKVRFLMLALSVLLISGGIAGTVMRGGFNLGIDFESGLNLRFQIAPSALTVSYDGDADLVFNLRYGQADFRMQTATEVRNYSFSLSDYLTYQDLAEAMMTVDGVRVRLIGNNNTATTQLIGLNFPVKLDSEPFVVNEFSQTAQADIEGIRVVLASLEPFQIQSVGAAENQEFILKIKDTGEHADFSRTIEDQIVQRLSAEYGSANVIVKQSDYIGPRFSEQLGAQSVGIVFGTLFLVLVYIWFRFKLAYSFSAIAALTHDVLFMLGVIGVFQFEVTTATIAAVLTIIGYSLNDTIVIFDRIRENVLVAKDSSFENIVNASITQSLSRTLITSVTTLLAVLAIFVFATGTVQDFAKNLIIGILVGTYSSIFVASPVLLGWTNASRKSASRKSAEKYGLRKEKEAHEEGQDTDETTKQNEDKVVEVPRIERKLKGKRKKK